MREKVRIGYAEDENGEEIEVLADYEWSICYRCEGEGQHSNPAIDGDGLPEDYMADDEFMEGYMNGDYDVRCQECKGSGKVKVANYDSVPKALMDQLEARWEAECQMQAEIDAERRMGC